MDTNNKMTPFKNNHFITLLISVIAIPLSMSMWIINIIYSKLIGPNEGLDGKFVNFLMHSMYKYI